MIPRRLFWTLDLAILFAAFFLCLPWRPPDL
ncbi:MAG: hypothetical protein KatS3mg061_0585 [Dehalococcoidia bacterium]|nr:MAG: hypothetical protein KatS3mg061_0585 [Dehalococcoidia bacterium]